MSAEVSCITLLWHFEFVSPIAICTAVALTWIRALWRVEIKSPAWVLPKAADSGAAGRGHWRARLKSRSLRMHGSKGAPGCAHLWHVKCVCQRGGVSFTYSSAKTLQVRSRASQPMDADILLRGCSWKGRGRRREAWYIHITGSSINRLFK